MDRTQVRLLAEFSLPSFAIGSVALLGAGLMGLLVGESLVGAVIDGLALGVPIALFGALYSVLVARKKVPVGVFAPACLYWAVAFPLAMLIHKVVSIWVLTGLPAFPPGPLWQFLAYNALLSMGFAIGFLWTHEYLGRQWWPRIMDHNPYAATCVVEYKELAIALKERKEEAARVRKEKKRRRAARPGTATR